MTLIAFVRNYEDLSTDRGYQFKFHCDKCGNGYMSSFQASLAGTAGSLLRAAGDLFGGVFGAAGNSAYEVQRAVGGKAHDDALRAAVEEGKKNFHQCARCGRWVCPQVCWNGQANMCNECAPNFENEMAAAHAQAKADAVRSQLHDKAAATDFVSGVDMRAGSVARGGAPQTVSPDACIKCGAHVGAAKFCPECGTPRARPDCPSCHAPIQAGSKFCGECGQKLI